MTVTIGNITYDTEFNTLNTAINKWFADNYPAVTFGDGNQTYGWGGIASAVVATTDSMLAVDMNRLIDRCNIGTNICNSVSGALSQIVVGNTIYTSGHNNTETRAALIDTNRLDIDPVELSLLTGDNSVRTTSYSTLINCGFRYTQASFAKQRHFWNSGGAINISGTISGYSIGEGYDGAGINEIFTSMGTVTMNYTATTQSGSGGTPTIIGYYDLTTSYQLIFSQAGSGAYSDAYCYIYAKLVSSTGNEVDIKVELVPETGRIVDGTTTITSQYRILDDQSSGAASLIITDPTPSVQNELEVVIATGGTITTSGDYKIHTFFTSGTFTVTAGGEVECLVIAGGGGGGGFTGGGGGAGGLVYDSFFNISSTVSVTVGDGGTGGTGSVVGTNGSNSVFSTKIAYGGGGGGTNTVVGSDGGSGGGAGAAGGAGGDADYISPRQGYDGGIGVGPPNYGAGGGGGAGVVGTNGTTTVGGAGGDGVSTYSALLIEANAGVDISGTHWIAGGGGGGSSYFGTDGAGGKGGGGSAPQGAGVVNTGGGGAGEDDNGSGAAGTGGSGIVIIKYKYQ